MQRFTWIIGIGLALAGGLIVFTAGRLDTYTWILFLGLTLAGGLIAFMGDRLGRYMGKRRLTVFGLRPRHTALLTTVVGGMLIAVTSLVTMSLVNVHVRQAVFDVGNLLRERRTLIQDRSRLQKLNHGLLRETAQLRSDHAFWQQRAATAAAEEKRSRDQLNRTLARLQLARENAVRRVALLERKVQERSQLAAQKSTIITRLGKQISGKQIALAETRNSLHTLEKRYRETTARYKEASAKLASAQHSFATTSQILQKTVAQHTQLQASMDKLLEVLRHERDQIQVLNDEKVALERSRSDLLAARANLQGEIARLQDDKQYQEEAAKRFSDSYELHRGNSVVVSLGEELSWEVIDGREPQASIRKHVLALIERARQLVVERGAGAKGDPERALVPARWYQQQAGFALQGEKAVEFVTEQISRANTGTLVQIIAATNTVGGEPVIGEIKVFINRLVFHAGEMIAQKSVDTRQPTGKVLEDLVALLQGEVRTVAVERGMIPRAEIPGSVTALQVGEASLAELVSTAEQARKHRGGVTVDVLAATDLWTADSMKLAFRVTPNQPADPGRGGAPGLTFK